MSADNSDAGYRKIKAANWSIVKLMDSPARAKWTIDNPNAGDTASRGMLRAVHALTLEPHAFADAFAVCDMRRDARSKGYQDFLAANEGKTILSEREHDDAATIAAIVRADPVAGPLITSPDARAEVSLLWTDEVTGIECKGRADLIITPADPALPIWVYDLKTVRDIDASVMGRDAVRMGYLGQLAHYAAGVEALNPGREVRAGIIAVTGSAPHEVAVLHLDSAMIGAGEAKRRPLLDRYAECVRADSWPARYTTPVYLDVPDWAYPDLSADDSADFGGDHE